MPWSTNARWVSSTASHGAILRHRLIFLTPQVLQNGRIETGRNRRCESWPAYFVFSAFFKSTMVLKYLQNSFLCAKANNNNSVASLTHWGRVTHICVGKPTNIGSYNGLSPGRRQAIIWTNAGISLIGPLGTNFSEILIGIQTFSFTKMYLKMSSAKWRPFYLGLSELIRKRLHSFAKSDASWAPSQYKDRLIYVWRFPC